MHSKSIVRQRITRARTFNTIDRENLVAGRVSSLAVREVWSELADIVDTGYADLTTVAVSRQHAAVAFLALPANLHRMFGADGPYGADTALIDAVDVRWVAANFGQAVLASGDHVVTSLARRLQSNGLHVIRVIGRGACSAPLYCARNEQAYLAHRRGPVVIDCRATESEE